jgi:hypothetical protein
MGKCPTAVMPSEASHLDPAANAPFAAELKFLTTLG